MKQLSPAESIHAALEVFIISLKVSDAIDKEVWDASALKKHVTWKGKTEPLLVPIHHHKVTTEELKMWTHNQQYYAAAMLAIATDNAVKRFYKNEPWEDPDSERRAARCILYMIRCSAAHNPIRPIWKCTPKYNQVFEVASLNMKLDCPALNGKPVKASDYGGWSKLKMLVDFCLDGLQ